MLPAHVKAIKSVWIELASSGGYTCGSTGAVNNATLFEYRADSWRKYCHDGCIKRFSRESAMTPFVYAVITSICEHYTDNHLVPMNSADQLIFNSSLAACRCVGKLVRDTNLVDYYVVRFGQI